MNPRWLAYCKAQGRTDAEQLAHDRARYPGGSMTGYVCWMFDRVHAFNIEYLGHCQALQGLGPAKARYGTEEADRLFDQFLKRETTPDEQPQTT